MTDEDIASEPGAYVCETCPVADALADLYADHDCARAWDLFQQCVNRFTLDAHLVGTVFQRVTAEMDGDEVSELVQRFGILYDAIKPPQKAGE